MHKRCWLLKGTITNTKFSYGHTYMAYGRMDPLLLQEGACNSFLFACCTHTMLDHEKEQCSNGTVVESCGRSHQSAFVHTFHIFKKKCRKDSVAHLLKQKGNTNTTKSKPLTKTLRGNDKCSQISQGNIAGLNIITVYSLWECPYAYSTNVVLTSIDWTLLWLRIQITLTFSGLLMGTI